MTREEIDIMWQQALQDSVRDGEMFTRYHFAKMIADKEREACSNFVDKILKASGTWPWENADPIRARGEAWTS